MCEFERERKTDCMCVYSVCVGRPQVSGHGVRVLRGLQRGPRLSASVSEGGSSRKEEERLVRVTNTFPEGCGGYWGAVADKQVRVLKVTLHT